MTCSLKVRKNCSATPLVSGSPTKAKLGSHAPELDLVLEVVGHERAAMVATEGKTACDPGRNGAELCFDRHADSLGSGVAITHLGNVPPHSFRVPVVDGVAISEVAAAFGVSRPTFYKAQDALQTAGLAGLLPSQRGPKGGHKISAEVVAYVAELKAENPELTTPQCLDAIEEHFGVKVHRRSLERALARKKKQINPP